MKLDDGLLFRVGEFPELEVRAEVVGPPEPAALPTSLKAGVLGNEAPVTGAMLCNVGRELVIFFRCPLTSLHIILLTAWNPPHVPSSSLFYYPFFYLRFFLKTPTIKLLLNLRRRPLENWGYEEEEMI